MAAQSPIDFADPDAVLQLVPGSGQRLVRLSFPDGTHLYSHPVALALGSGVLRNVLEDTQGQQHQQQLQKKQKAALECTTIPLDDDADAFASWKIALALMHNQQADEVTMDNAQTLLLLADKYEMPCITGPVREFLSAKPFWHSRGRLEQHLTRETVVGWLTAASKCGLQQAVKECIDFIVDQQMPVSFDTLCSLNRADADALLAAMHKKIDASIQKVAACKNWLGPATQLKGVINILSCAKCSLIWADASASSSSGVKCPKCNSTCHLGARPRTLDLSNLHRILQKP